MYDIKALLANPLRLLPFLSWIGKIKDSSVLTADAVAGIAGISNYVIFIFFLHSLNFFDLFAKVIGIAIGAIINYSINSYKILPSELKQGDAAIVGASALVYKEIEK